MLEVKVLFKQNGAFQYLYYIYCILYFDFAAAKGGIATLCTLKFIC